MKNFGSSWGLWLRGVAITGASLALSVGSISCSSRQVAEDGVEAEVAAGTEAEAGADENAGDVAAEVAPQVAAEQQDQKQDPNLVPVEAVAPAVTQRQEQKKVARMIRKAAVAADSVAVSDAPKEATKAVEEPLQKQPFERLGAMMNAYYFVRGEGSWVDLAQKIYRDPARSEDLKAWNPGVQITTGAVVYYMSPVRVGSDVGMKPFYEDFSAAAESYTVQKGDTLAKIAQSKLGSAHSRLEIADANPGVDLKKLSPGMTIVVPPAQVDNAQILERLAQEQLEIQRKNRQAEEAAKAAQAAQAQATAVTSNTEAQPDAEPKRTPAAWESGPAGKVLETLNALPVPPQFLGAGLLVLLGVAFLLRRRFQ